MGKRRYHSIQRWQTDRDAGEQIGSLRIQDTTPFSHDAKSFMNGFENYDIVMDEINLLLDEEYRLIRGNPKRGHQAILVTLSSN